MLRATTTFLILALLCFAVSPSVAQEYSFDFLGMASFQTGHMYKDVELGGLSGISYDPARNLYLVISDDRSNLAPARFYTLQIDLADGKLREGDVQFLTANTLMARDGKSFARGSIDPEGIVWLDRQTILVSSEGSSDTVHPPFIRKFSLEGGYLGPLELPQKFIPSPERDHGIRRNKGFEALSVTADSRYLYAANEEALIQDGPEAGLGVSSPVRILKYDIAGERLLSEYLYEVEAVDVAPSPSGGFHGNGLVELIALNENSLIAMERRYSQGVGTGIKLFQVSLADADDISMHDGLKGLDLDNVKKAEKSFLFDVSDTGVAPDNVEGMTLGARLPDGRTSLILVSDNNFNKEQMTQFIALALPQQEVKVAEPTISEIQGAGHRSPLLHQPVQAVRGVVTGKKTLRNRHGYWIQDSDGDRDDAISNGIFVSTDRQPVGVEVGNLVQVSGTVAEVGRRAELTITQIIQSRVEVLSAQNELPRPATFGKDRYKLPDSNIDDDKMTSYDPATDAIDLFESLEGMLVQVEKAVVVGPTSRFSECVVLANEGKKAGQRSKRGGIVVQQDDFNPERILVNFSQEPEVPALTVGDRFKESVVGVLDYSFGNYKLMCSSPLPERKEKGLRKEVAELKAGGEQVTIVTYNVENLDAEDTAEKFSTIAENIVKGLLSPDILALQEVQDDNGAADNGVSSATKTFGRLISAIQEAGGPEYDFCQIDPVHNQEGGQPVGNIRVGYLFNPGRIHFDRRGSAGSLDAVGVRASGDRAHLSLNPGRVAPTARAFARDQGRSYSSSRPPLAAEFGFNGHRLFLINNHFRSKGGDERLFGARQPPRFRSEIQRNEQAEVVRAFVDSLLSRNSDANVIVLGDLNEHEFRAPLQTLVHDDVLTNLVERVSLNRRYTYVFNGNSQVLDHVLVSKNLLDTAEPAIEIVHINAEYAHSERASDHDPVLARFKLPANPAKSTRSEK